MSHSTRISFCSCSSERRAWTKLLLLILVGFTAFSVSFQGVYEDIIEEDLASHELKNESSSTFSHPSAGVEENNNEAPDSTSDLSKESNKPALKVSSEDDDDDSIPRSCFVDYRTPLERSADTLELYQQAQKHGFGNCGENIDGASLDRTVANFAQNPITVSKAKEQKAWLNIEPNRQYAPIYHVTFNFQAYTESNVPRFLGGDEFILTFKGWAKTLIDNTVEAIAFKTAVVARDNHNGTYSATLPIPQGLSLTNYNMTMMHYFTCYQGHTINRTWSNIRQVEYKSVNYGPINVVAHESFSEYLMQTNSSAIVTTKRKKKKLPACPLSQEGVDWYSHGVWFESGIPDQVEITNSALWSPLCCQPPQLKPVPSMLRIGDSTMPSQSIQIGNVYDQAQIKMKKSYDMWIDYLWQLLFEEDKELSGVNSNVLILNSALHFVLLGGVHPTLVPELVIRMICQLGLIFPGKIIWVGPVPIQEHHFKMNDQKDVDVQLTNAVMRDLLQVQSGGKLKRRCRKVPVGKFEALADPTTGQFISDEENQLKLQERRQSLNVTEHREPVVEKLQSLSVNANELYGDRNVWFAEIDHFRRPRPESYRDKDKIHDMRNVPGLGMLFFNRHKEWIYTLAKFRHLGEG